MIGIVQKGDIWIVGCEEEFATKDPKRAQEMLSILANMKKENGQLYQLEEQTNEERATNEHVEILQKKCKKLEADIEYYKKMAEVNKSG